MAYQVLARKWRPKKFADLVGQEHVVGALRNALAQGRLHHAYLLTGTRGVGKTTIARILAKSLNCEHLEQGEPCGVCDQCTQIDTGRHVDVVEIDAASNTGIDNIREVLENAQYAPSMGRYKVYIIDEVHMLSKSAFNAMLKTLEEPPEHVKFILATTDPQKVPVTVLSRCLQFVLRNMTPQQIQGHLQTVLTAEHIDFETSGLTLLARAASGSMRDALSLLDQAIALGSGQVQENTIRTMLGAVDRQFVYRLLAALAQGDAHTVVEQAQQMRQEGAGFAQVLQELSLVLQQLALLQLLPNAMDDEADAVQMQQLAQQMSAEQIQLFYQCAIHGKNDLALAPDEQAGVMMTLLRMLAMRPLGVGEVAINQTIRLPKSETPTAAHTESQIPSERPVNTLQDAQKGVERAVKASTAQSEAPAADVHSASVAAEQGGGGLASKLAETVETAKSELAESEPETESNEADAAEFMDLPPWETLAADSESAVGASEEVLQDAAFDTDTVAVTVKKNDEYLVQAPISSEPLPLNTENWPHIVQQIAPQLSAARMLANHAGLVSFDAQSGELRLEITHEGKVIEDRQYLSKLSDTLSQYMGTDINVVVQDWQGEVETPHAQALRQEEEKRQHGLAILAADATAQQLISLFEGEWLPESVHLKSSS